MAAPGAARFSLNPQHRLQDLDDDEESWLVKTDFVNDTKKKPNHKEEEFSSSECVSSSLKSVSSAFEWMVKNRGGLAYLSGLAMVPSQFFPGSSTLGSAILKAQELGAEIETFSKSLKTTDLRGVVYFPPKGQILHDNRCILYHNPNGAIVKQFLRSGRLEGTPGELAKMQKCPVVLYDYRGTGLSQEGNISSSTLSFKPTYSSVLEDGRAALQYALSRFEYVDVVGSSLGGGVATVSLSSCLEKVPDLASRVTLLNHDSFSTTAEVVFPGRGNWGVNWLGWIVGGLIDAGKAMKSLQKRGVKIVVLAQKRDPVIPQGARMVDFLEAAGTLDTVSHFTGETWGHADLDRTALRFLSNCWRVSIPK